MNAIGRRIAVIAALFAVLNIKEVSVAIENPIPREELSSTEQPALPEDLILQEDIEGGNLSVGQVRMTGLLVFTTPFNRLDGYGDGQFDPEDPDHTSFDNGNRPGMQTEFTPFLRVNGLDSQTCLECHSILSSSAVPPTFGIGGHSGLSNNAVFLPTEIDVDAYDESTGESGLFAFLNGRFINPPFLFGAGGVQLLANEMTDDLQAIRKNCIEQDGTYELETKGVSFGSITCSGGKVTQMDIDGNGLAVDNDLVVRPFGRKGEFATTRAFDRSATRFHLGIQPEEVMLDQYGDKNADGDGDGVTNELTVGEMSALSVFISCLPSAKMEMLDSNAKAGKETFDEIGCSQCHIPAIEANKSKHSQAFPEVETDPEANVFIVYDLFGPECPTNFRKNLSGGLTIPLFADLKRHDMGDVLAETAVDGHGAPLALNRYFTTARLWGVGDSAPYLHDGRAQTLTEAILQHGGNPPLRGTALKSFRMRKKRISLNFYGPFGSRANSTSLA